MHTVDPQLLKGHEIDGNKGQVTQQEGVVARKQTPWAFIHSNAGHGCDCRLEFACTTSWFISGLRQMSGRLRSRKAAGRSCSCKMQLLEDYIAIVATCLKP